jgi:hypothetical protein
MGPGVAKAVASNHLATETRRWTSSEANIEADLDPGAAKVVAMHQLGWLPQHFQVVALLWRGAIQRHDDISTLWQRRNNYGRTRVRALWSV